MKKKIGSIVLVLILSIGLVGCGQKQGTCRDCGKEAPLYKTIVTTQYEDEPVVDKDMCKNCANVVKEFVDEVNAIVYYGDVKIEKMKKNE